MNEIGSIAWGFAKERFFPKWSVRPSTSFMKYHFNSHSLTGVEIGSQYGYNAYSLLKQLRNLSLLYLVDPYASYDEYTESWATNDGVNVAFEKAKKIVSPYQLKTRFIRKFSDEAVDDIPNIVDFVYIDGNHDYEFVKQDIDLYYPRVRSGGVLCGHDFATHELGVCRAVVEFVNEYDLELFGEKYDWWVIKP